jgi:hypothetical protein
VHELPLVDPAVWGGDAHSRGIEVKNDSTVYLADGAVLLGGLRVYNAHNVTIRGFGIIAATFLPGEAIGADRECAPQATPSLQLPEYAYVWWDLTGVASIAFAEAIRASTWPTRQISSSRVSR